MLIVIFFRAREKWNETYTQRRLPVVPSTPPPKEVWVKRVVPEHYTTIVEVPKTRVVRVPVKESKIVQDFETVHVVEHRPMSVSGFRIDTIQGDQSTKKRIIGAEVYHPNDERVRNLQVDSRAPSRAYTPAILQTVENKSTTEEASPSPQLNKTDSVVRSRRIPSDPVPLGFKVAKVRR